MERVICVKCGSIGYTASPEQVPCSDCGGKHKVIRAKNGDFKPLRKDRILSMLGMRTG